MDIREKLVEILTNAGMGKYETQYIADILIDNGITIQEPHGCKYCLGARYTEQPFIVITQMGKEVETQFNFCPNCGCRLPQSAEGE